VRLEKGGEREEGSCFATATGCVCSSVRTKLLCHGDGKERVPNSENGRWLMAAAGKVILCGRFCYVIYLCGLFCG
jgi:hypothetical protein